MITDNIPLGSYFLLLEGLKYDPSNVFCSPGRLSKIYDDSTTYTFKGFSCGAPRKVLKIFEI